MYYDNNQRFKTLTNGVTIVDYNNTPILEWQGASNNNLGKIDCDQTSPTTAEMRFYTEDGGSLAEHMRINSHGFVKAKGNLASYISASSENYHEFHGDQPHNVLMNMKHGSSNGYGVIAQFNHADAVSYTHLTLPTKA